MKPNNIILGDVLSELDKIEKSRKFDVIIADPPYNIGKNFGNNLDKRELPDYLAWSKEWINACLNLLADNGLMYIYGQPEILARIATEHPLANQRILVWHYTNKNTPSCNFWQRSYESILCLWKNDRPSLEINQIREPYTKGRFGDKTTTYNVNKKGAMPRDVIKVPALAGGAGKHERNYFCKKCDTFFSKIEKSQHDLHDIVQHPTQKPSALTRKLIQSRIVDKGSVLIPFAGSGSECVVARDLGLDYLGIEINPDYVRYANKWLSIPKLSELRGLCKDVTFNRTILQEFEDDIEEKLSNQK